MTSDKYVFKYVFVLLVSSYPVLQQFTSSLIYFNLKLTKDSMQKIKSHFKLIPVLLNCVFRNAVVLVER